jgi:hypothetical protein
MCFNGVYFHVRAEGRSIIGRGRKKRQDEEEFDWWG